MKPPLWLQCASERRMWRTFHISIRYTSFALMFSMCIPNYYQHSPWLEDLPFLFWDIMQPAIQSWIHHVINYIARMSESHVVSFSTHALIPSFPRKCGREEEGVNVAEVAILNRRIWRYVEIYGRWCFLSKGFLSNKETFLYYSMHPEILNILSLVFII